MSRCAAVLLVLLMMPAVAGGGSYLDRTTLIPLGDRRVRQLIEISTDDGATSQPTFTAVYVRR